MAGNLSFNVGEIRRLVDHSIAAPSQRPSYEDLFNPAYHKGGKVKMKDGGTWPDQDNLDLTKLPKAVHLVKDDGVYIMSAGSPGLTIPGKDQAVVAYAAEANPKKLEFDDWWEAARRIMGGDDSVTSLPVTMFAEILKRKRDDQTITLKVTARSIRVLMS